MPQSRNTDAVRTIEALEPRRLFAAGQLDTSFSGDGLLNTRATDAAVQVDGKVVTLYAGKLTRLNANGSIDTTFGTGGSLTVPANRPFLNAVALQPDGKIVVATEDFNPIGFQGYWLRVLRFLPTGKLDTSFNGDGIFSSDQVVKPSQVLIQRDGKIVVIGGTENIFSNDDFAVLRLTASGNPDPTFGNPSVVPGATPGSRSGIRYVGFGGDETAYAGAVDYQGTASTNPRYGYISVVGGAGGKFGVARLKANGDMDNSFSSDGRLTQTFNTTYSAYASSVVLQPGGKVVVAGKQKHPSNGNQTANVVRYTSAGVVDTTFGSAGFRPIALRTTTDSSEVGMVQTFGGKLMLSGDFNNADLYAITKDGQIDTSFGNAGAAQLSTADTFVGGRLYNAPGNKLIFSDGFTRLGRVLDLGPTVELSTIDSVASETAGNSATVFVTRGERLPVATRVYFNVTGTASRPQSRTGPIDYAGLSPNIGPLDNRYYVDIPANETFALVTITPVNDTLVEPSETVIFTLAADNAYSNNAAKSSVTLRIDDNDVAPRSLSATADTYVQSGAQSGTNFGATTPLQVKNAPPASGLYREAYIKFDLSSVSTVSAARLRLFGSLNNTNVPSLLAQVCSSSSTSWTEGSLNYNNRPAVSSTVLASATIVGTTSAWYEFDLTDFIRAEKLAGRNIVTLVLRNISPNPATDPYIRFNSREAGSNKPELLVS